MYGENFASISFETDVNVGPVVCENNKTVIQYETKCYEKSNMEIRF